MTKYIFGIFIIILTASFTPAPQLGQFEGEIHYTTTYTYFPSELARYADQMPRTMDVYVRENLVCKEGPTALANGYQIHIKNLSTHTGYTAMSSGNTYVAYRKGQVEFQSELDAMETPTSIEYVNETKTFAGYVCKKALVYMPSSSKPFVVYYTDKIRSDAFVVYKGLKGFPIYYEGNMKGVTFYSEAIAIHPRKQADTKFLLPKEYSLLSYEEFKRALIKMP